MATPASTFSSRLRAALWGDFIADEPAQCVGPWLLLGIHVGGVRKQNTTYATSQEVSRGYLGAVADCFFRMKLTSPAVNAKLWRWHYPAG